MPLFIKKILKFFILIFFNEFIGSGVTSMIMEELREKRQLIYNVNLDNYKTPYGTYITIEISSKNKHIEQVVIGVLKILKNLVYGRFSSEYLEYVKKAYMVNHYSTCTNNTFLSEFYGQQYINQLYNTGEQASILTFNEVAEKILKLRKMNFVLFVKRLIIFANMKIAYQGKREVVTLHKKVAKMLDIKFDS